MCGIAGASSLNENTRRLLPFLAYEMEERGDDSWGVLTPSYVHKELGPITSGWTTGDTNIMDLLDEGQPVSIHTRAGSVGSITQENSHPFTVVGSKCTVVGMHNGCVANWKELETTYGVTYNVDSHYICHAIANGLDTEDIRGWGAFVWLQWENDSEGNPTGEPTLNFVRFNMTDFYLAKINDGASTNTIVWCSTKNALIKACNMADTPVAFFYDFQSETHYRYLKEKEGVSDIKTGYPMATLGKMQFGRRGNCATVHHPNNTPNHPPAQVGKPKVEDYDRVPSQPPVAGVNFSVGDIGRNLREGNRCLLCKIVHVDRTNKAVCGLCIKEVNDAVGGLYNHKSPQSKKFMIFGYDWEYNGKGELVFISDESENAFVSVGV